VIGKLQTIVLDCPDVLELARFYQALLGGEVNKPDGRWSLNDDWATLHTDSGVLCFQRVEDYRAPRWPDPEHPQQFHLDFEVDDLDDASAKLRALGATVLREDRWIIMADPAGHPFCLLRKH
jgi:catechol 2,3-dioxygenase-like lactoylglutathione lyase family enzyme